MKAVLIDPENTMIKDIELSDDDGKRFDELRELIGCRAFDFVQLYPNGDGIFIDDEGMLIEEQHFFHHINVEQSIAGKSVFVGIGDEGETTSPDMDAVDIHYHLTWLGSRDKVVRMMRMISPLVKAMKEYQQ